MNPKVFPTIMIALSAASSIFYAFDGNWRMTLYWLSASVLTTVVTY
jgi:hypothetical protein